MLFKFAQLAARRSWPDGKEVALRVGFADGGVRDLPAQATVPIPERQ